MDLSKQTIIVTGAAQGVGLALSKSLLGYGANVVMVDINAEPLNEFAASQDSGRVLVQGGSVADPDFVENSVAHAVGHFGAVHGVVNNAGITRPAMLENMTLDQWRQVIDVHLTGSFLYMKQACRHMIERFNAGDETPGAIVNISSDTGKSGTIGQINYSAAKAGVLGLTTSGAREMAKYGIRVNTVIFGMVETPMTETIRSERFRDRYLAEIPMGRWAQPEEVADPICYLFSSGASYITGQHISVNGGRRIWI